MSNPIIINERSYSHKWVLLSVRARLYFLEEGDGPFCLQRFYRDQEWPGRTGHCAELALTPSCQADPIVLALLTELPSCVVEVSWVGTSYWAAELLAMITEAEVDNHYSYRDPPLISSLRCFTHTETNRIIETFYLLSFNPISIHIKPRKSNELQPNPTQ